ncbi:MAG: hypothetical protein KOO60_12390 [Gemmatimonadales bacterium]|nr:hypothetical protein [Gemmatimonadales bacterium]
MRPLIRALVFVGLTAFCTAGSAPAQESRTAVLVFIAWQELEGSVLDPTLLRQATTRFLAGALISQGCEVVPDEKLAPLVTRWRQRNSLMLRDEFLAELDEELNGDRLLLVQLFLQPRRLLMAWRLIDTSSGILLSVGFSEAGLGAFAREPTAVDNPGQDIVQELRGSGVWLRAAEAAARALVLPAGDPDPDWTQPLVVLPTRSVGSEFGSTALASHCLLEELVMRHGQVVPDPGLVVTTLRQSGYGPGQMNAQVRDLLRERFGSHVALLGKLIAYDIADARSGPAVPDVEGALFGADHSMDGFALSLMKVDLESGRVLASFEVFEDRSVEFGWFGVQHRYSLLERLQIAVVELWTGIGVQLEAGGNGNPH